MDMNTALAALLAKAKADYAAWWGAKANDAHVQKMIEEYNAGIRIEEGNTYYKVIIQSGSQNSVHSFVVKADTKKFRAGDVLKPASWKAPATNFARGNILEGNFDRIRWTGAL